MARQVQEVTEWQATATATATETGP